VSAGGERQGQPATSSESSDALQLRCAPPEELQHWVERRRKKLPEDSLRRKLYDSFFLPLDPPTQFTGAREHLVEELMPRKGDEPDEERTKEVLVEAQGIYAAADARVEGAERRATTLQGAVAIAASLLLAGGALLADPSKVRGDGWRLAFALVLVTVVFCLVMSGARALAATSRIHVFHRPTAGDITRRSGLSLAEARIELAAETLRNYACNTKVADWKVAAWWFRLALVALLAVAVLLGLYGVFAPDQPPRARTGSVPKTRMM
jgi:hypothetical protein